MHRQRGSPGLRRDEVERLLADPSDETRAELTARVGAVYARGGLTPGERAQAEGILRAVTQDAAVLVRRTLARAVRACPDLPRDVAMALATDIERVAAPILETSPVLGEADLIALLRRQGAGHQAAIARRADLTERVADSLAEHAAPEAVETLLANEAAPVGARIQTRILDRFPASDAVRAAMLRRPEVAPETADRILGAVARHFVDRLGERTRIPGWVADELIVASHAQALVEMVSVSELDADGDSLMALMARLDRQGRLDDALILRALCRGDRRFVAAALAQLAGATAFEARAALADPDPTALDGLIMAAGLAPGLASPLRAFTLDAQSCADSGALVARLRERVRAAIEHSDPQTRADLARRLADLELSPAEADPGS